MIAATSRLLAGPERRRWTSGGPFLADVSAASGQGTVTGVIGGYEQGGDTPQVSYASAFGPWVGALYRSAEAGG
jgi:hypothetical protein